MVRHEVRFVLQFGVFAQVQQLLEQLHVIERRHNWAEPRCWRAAAGRVNELVIVHDYENRDAYEAQRTAYHESGDAEHVAALAAIAELMVPGTATETLYEEI
jgi:hypothetical protein